MSSFPDKDAARREMKARRAGLSDEQRATGSRALAVVDLSAVLPNSPQIISGFLPIGDEIDPGPLMQVLRARGWRLALPVMQGRAAPLLFRTYVPGDALDTVQWGIREPKPEQPVVLPDVLLVPLLAFDPAGNRLGYGAGHYDRTIARLKTLQPIVTLGLAFDAQRIDAVPHLGYDEPLDWVLTPSGPMECQRRSRG